MNLQECYQAFGGDYEDTVKRMGMERLLQKFMLKFLDDKSFEELCTSMEQKKYEEAFRAAHTLKGLCLNLGFKVLAESSSNLTEVLRPLQFEESDLAKIMKLLEQVKRDYAMTVSVISEFKDGLEA